MSAKEPIDLTARRNTIEAQRQKLKARLKPKSPRAAYRSDQVYPERLIWAREMMGFSQDDWAEILGVLPMEYRTWEEGTAQPNLEQLNNLAEITGMFKPGWFCQPVNDGWPGIEETTLRFH